MSPQNLTTELEAVFILSAAALRCQQQPWCVPYKRVELWVQLSITVGDRWPQCTVTHSTISLLQTNVSDNTVQQWQPQLWVTIAVICQ